jgi:hypothetical protein
LKFLAWDISTIAANSGASPCKAKIYKYSITFVWVKGEAGRYLWVNQALAEMAQQAIVGKTDHELGWAADAEALRAADNQVLETGKTLYLREYAHFPGRGKVTLNVYKFVGELDGKRASLEFRSLSSKKLQKAQV